jgi:hypothetical protein
LNTRPDVVFANKVDPSVEYQTRSTGPVAADGSAVSWIAEFPTCRQLTPVPWPQTGADASARATHGKSAEALDSTARIVVLRHIK